MSFGGRIAEEVFLNQMTTGASNDFQHATDMARRMVTEWGMSDALGPMVYGENEGEVFLGRSVTTHKNMSEATMQKVDAEVRRIIDQQYAVARKLIEENRDEGRENGQDAARVGDDRCRPDQRHHGRTRAASAEAGDAGDRRAAEGSAPESRHDRRTGAGNLSALELSAVKGEGRA